VGTRRTRDTETRSEYIGLRMKPSELAEIRARAQARDMTLTEYMTRAGLGELDDNLSRTERAIVDLQERMDRLEQQAGLGAFD
jgi:uncharacterized protein (DUF1778 family)